MTAIGAGSRENSLELQTGDNVGVFGVAKGIVDRRIKGPAPLSQNNRPHVQGKFPFLIMEVYGLAGTKLFAGFAFAFCLFPKIDALFRINNVFQRNRLAVVGIRHFFRAFFSAQTTGNALVHIHVTGMLRHTDLKIPLLPGNAVHFRQGKQLYINVPADLDQFG
jgi:hypothetical protein